MTAHGRPAGAVAAAVLVLVVGGCSLGSDPAGAPSTTAPLAPIEVDPCSLLTDAEIAAVRDGLAAGVSDDVSGEHTCAWRNRNGIAVVHLEIGVVAGDTLTEALARAAFAGDTFTALDAIGDEAVAIRRGRASAGQTERVVALVARRGSTVLTLGLPGLDIADDRDPAFAAATVALTAAVARL